MHISHLPPTALPQFARLNTITLSSTISPTAHGLGLHSTSSAPPYLRIPKDLIACAYNIEEWSKADTHLRALLSAVPAFVQTPRGPILIFLILRMSNAAGLGVGIGDAWSEYVRFLPERVGLPTEWVEEERALLAGTSLRVAVEAKLVALQEEFEAFRDATMGFSWARKAWWDNGALGLADWVRADSVFRSRNLEIPGLGVGMVPVLDFANHRGDGGENCYYQEEGEDVLLRGKDAVDVKEGEELTICYGAEKSAAEMLFSYGFIDDAMERAGSLVLAMKAPEDDPLALAKERILSSAPILSFSSTENEKRWDCTFVWLACVNEEDGLQFRVLKEPDGGRTLQMFWGDEVLEHVEDLRGKLEKSKMWPIFELRATAMCRERMAEKLAEWEFGEDGFVEAKGKDGIGQEVWTVSERLRRLERVLLVEALVWFDAKIAELVENEVVREYLGRAQGGEIEEEEDEDEPFEDPDLS